MADTMDPVEQALRNEYAKRGIMLEPYLAGPRHERFERVESHGFDDALEIVKACARVAIAKAEGR